MKTSPFNSFSLFRRKKPQPPTGPIKIDTPSDQYSSAVSSKGPEAGRLDQSTGPLENIPPKGKGLPSGQPRQGKSGNVPQSATPIFDNSQSLRPATRELTNQNTGSNPPTATSSKQSPTSRKSKKNNKLGRALLITLIIMLFVCGIVAGGYFIIRYFQQIATASSFSITTIPSATPVPIVETPTPFPTLEPSPMPTTIPEIIPSVTPSGLCNQTGQMVILVVADDEGNWVYPYGADVIRLVGINFDKNSVIVYSIPRDLRLTTSPLNKYGIQEYPLGPSFSLVQQREGMNKEAAIVAINALAQVIYDNFGISADYYLILHHSIFRKTVDSVGGIKVTVSNTITDSILGLYLNQGEQLLNGLTVEKYMRYLKGHSTFDEWGRFSRQNEILKSLHVLISSDEIVSKAPAIIADSSNLLTTDLSVDLFLDLLCTARKIPSEGVLFEQIQRNNIIFRNDGSMDLINKQQVIDQLSQLFK